MSKIPKIESKSQQLGDTLSFYWSDSDVKDTQNWKQITTETQGTIPVTEVIAMSKIPKIESKSQQQLRNHQSGNSDSDVKDTQNWKQITTWQR